jgi:hypothetical protein
MRPLYHTDEASQSTNNYIDLMAIHADQVSRLGMPHQGIQGQAL